MLSALKPGRVKPSASWLHDLGEHKKRNTERMKAHLAADPKPMDFYSALGAIRGVLADNPEIYVVNEGANTLDIGRNVIDSNRQVAVAVPMTVGFLAIVIDCQL